MSGSQSPTTLRELLGNHYEQAKEALDEIDKIARQLERTNELEAIVRAVAETHPIADYGDGSGCFFCEGPGDEPDGHQELCPWLKARKAMGLR